MNHRPWKFTGLTAAAALTLIAQTSPVREMNLLIGRGELLQFERDLSRVVVAEPKIADAVVVSPREVMVNAKGVGKTTLVIWEAGAIPARINVNVQADTSDFDAILKDVRGRLPEGATLSGNKDKLVLVGMVKDTLESKRAEAVAAPYATAVVNTL
ncbi:MAG TPA: pilus assembly protein N-terminal domain-containing protein [Bryobacteraceae bacterium]|nr:pilus assembly protein N-terminal domain-containing protein [Bryobacteraceae bacterium]